MVRVPEVVHNCVAEFLLRAPSPLLTKPAPRKQKLQEELLFDLISAQDLNDYFKEFLPGLSAKVFRTYNASYTLEQELLKFSWEKLEKQFRLQRQEGHQEVSKNVTSNLVSSKSSPVKVVRALERKISSTLCDMEEENAFKVAFEKMKGQLLLDFFTNANREVAVLCNHQRTVSSGHASQAELLNFRILCVERERDFLSVFLRDDFGPSGSSSGKQEKAFDKGEKALKRLQKELEDATNRLDETLSGSSLKDSRRFLSLKAALPRTVEGITERLVSLVQKMGELKKTLKGKDELKTVALGTSKMNYLDPRITVAFCRRTGMEVSKVFSKTHLAKFPWALDAEEDYRFNMMKK